MKSLLNNNTSDVTSKLNTLSKSVQKLGRHANILGTNADTSQFRQNLKRDVIECVNLSKQLRQLFNELEYRNVNNPKIIKLSKQFDSEFKKFSEYYGIIKSKTRNNTNNIESKIDNELANNNNNNNINNVYEQKVEQKFKELDTTTLERKEEQIYDILNDLETLQDIFGDLQSMISGQGDMINEIQANTQNVKDNVIKAESNINNGARYQNKSRKRMCCILVILLIIFGILAVIISVETRNNN
mmetsp:Transcript_37277/g.46050  ORF Transcript_37277/g.46050 Transcript_37277/m.46050 type:complete len:243 (-) Transcript_37277:53-781(-)